MISETFLNFQSSSLCNMVTSVSNMSVTHNSANDIGSDSDSDWYSHCDCDDCKRNDSDSDSDWYSHCDCDDCKGYTESKDEISDKEEVSDIEDDPREDMITEWLERKRITQQTEIALDEFFKKDRICQMEEICSFLGIEKGVHIYNNLYGYPNHWSVYKMILKLSASENVQHRNSIIEQLKTKHLRGK